MQRLLIAPTLALCLLPGTGAASVEDAKAARVMFTAFECSAYADMMGEDARRRQLVDVGVAAGRQFLAALEAGEISDDDLRQHAPFMTGTDLDQPSPDFMIGRMFQGTYKGMHQKVSSKDKAGKPLPEDQWLFEGEDFEAKAKWHYQTPTATYSDTRQGRPRRESPRTHPKPPCRGRVRQPAAPQPSAALHGRHGQRQHL